MKKNLLFVTAILLLSTSQSFGQNKRSATIATPVFWTSAYNINTAFGAGTYCLDNLADLVYSASYNYLSYDRPVPSDANGYAYVIESRTANNLHELLGGVATSVVSEAIYIRNTGTGNINMFAGWFGNVTVDGNKFDGNGIRITIDDYVYNFNPNYESTYIGFVFPESFTEVKIESTSGYCPAISKIYWGSSLTTGVSETTKQVVISPNPTVDGITVNAEGTVSIFSTAGQLLMSEEVTVNAYLPLAGLNKGLYIVRIETSEGVLQEKLIKK